MERGRLKRTSTSAMYVLSCVKLLAEVLPQTQAPRLTVVVCLQHAKAGLPMGKRGVLLTCMGGKEMQAGRDAVRILTQARPSQSLAGASQSVCLWLHPARNSADGQACLVAPHCCPASSRDQAVMSLVACCAVL